MSCNEEHLHPLFSPVCAPSSVCNMSCCKPSPRPTRYNSTWELIKGGIFCHSFRLNYEWFAICLFFLFHPVSHCSRVFFYFFLLLDRYSRERHWIIRKGKWKVSHTRLCISIYLSLYSFMCLCVSQSIYPSIHLIQLVNSLIANVAVSDCCVWLKQTEPHYLHFLVIWWFTYSCLCILC